MNQAINQVCSAQIKKENRKRRIRLRDRALPPYTRGEEIFNMVSHIVGGAVGIAALSLCVVLSALGGNVTGIICGSIFGASMILLYTMSSIYHGLRAGTAKKIFQIFDHCTINLLIAGTYTPLLVCALAKVSPLSAFITFLSVWSITVLSTTLTAIDIEKYKKFSMAGYLGMGWAIIFSASLMLKAIGAAGFALLLGGGILYTTGVIFFRLGVKKKYFHSIFHIFVLLGSIAHALCVLFYAIL